VVALMGSLAPAIASCTKGDNVLAPRKPKAPEAVVFIKLRRLMGIVIQVLFPNK
jgi:hypothetical protein